MVEMPWGFMNFSIPGFPNHQQHGWNKVSIYQPRVPVHLLYIYMFTITIIAISLFHILCIINHYHHWIFQCTLTFVLYVTCPFFYQPHFSGSPRHILAMSSRVKVNRSSPFWAMLVDHHKSCHLADLQMVAAQMATRTYWKKYEKNTCILYMHHIAFR